VVGGSNCNVGSGFVSSCVGVNLGHQILGPKMCVEFSSEIFCTIASRSGVAFVCGGFN
jgi:hypothetical protein